jgi:hypothetical protein
MNPTLLSGIFVLKWNDSISQGWMVETNINTKRPACWQGKGLEKLSPFGLGGDEFW